MSADIKKTKTYMNHYFCHGEYTKARYMKSGHAINNYHPIGSLKAGYYKYKSKGINTKKYKLGIVSEYIPFRENPTLRIQKMNQSLDLLYTFLNKYIQEYKISAAIFMRNPMGYNDEKEYFQKFFGDSVEYIFHDIKKMSTYSSMEMSEVVVGLMSTANIEAFGWGSKILLADFTRNKDYTDVFNYDPMITFHEPNYEDYKKRLNELIREPQEEYIKRTKDYASYLMNNDPDCPPHIYIRNMIDEYL
tara:strand:- start:1886 stop:2626 length:741 start_codon:yes stop_codon:yes gene_type:complete